MADQKQRLRKAMRNCRDALPREQAEALSRSIQTRALSLGCYRGAAAVLLYAAVGNEVATDLILEDALAAGRSVFYPIANRDTGRLDFRAVSSRADLHAGQFGIPEPCAGQAFVPPHGEGAVIFVPGLAFTASGQRLGRGGGFYDRFLASTGPGLTAVGLGYSFQMLERLPQEPWDQRLACVVTERAVIQAERPGQWRA